MRNQLVLPAVALLVAVVFAGACAASSEAVRTDMDRLTTEEIASVDVASLFEVVQRLRPRWLEVRAARSGFQGPPTEIVVFMDRTFLGGADELRRLGRETAVSLQYMTGARASAQLSGLGSRHVEGAIIVHTR